MGIDQTVEIIWFGDGWGKLTVDGYQVPMVRARQLPARNGQPCVALVLDERFEIDVPELQLDQWLPWVANAMAICGGYTSFGANSRPSNPYQMRMIGLSHLPGES